MTRRPRQFVEVHINKIVQVDGDHGGYLTAFCLVCGNRGWLDGKHGYAHKAKNAPSAHLIHKAGCPMNRHALKEKVA